MRIGILSDIHGNLEALETVLAAMNQQHIDRLICLGDIVGYGPDPNACVESILSAADCIVAGNHDMAASGQISTEHFNTQARQALDWTKSVISGPVKSALTRLPMTDSDELLTAVHATPYEPGQWHYLFSEQEARLGFLELKTRICFVGHSHVPVAFIQEKDGNITLSGSPKIAIEEDKAYIINVGSVGQPRDNDARACLGILDTKEKSYVLQRHPYPIWLVQEKMANVKLPMTLIERLSYGL